MAKKGTSRRGRRARRRTGREASPEAFGKMPDEVIRRRVERRSSGAPGPHLDRRQRRRRTRSADLRRHLDDQ